MQFFYEGSVVRDLQNVEKFAAIHELLSKAAVFRKIKNIESFEQVVVQREKKLSTGLGHGVAFAHGKTDVVDSLNVALGISRKGIDFKALDNKPVHLLFIVANPVNGHREYLELISALSKILRDDEFRERILKMDNEKTIETEFRQALENLMVRC